MTSYYTLLLHPFSESAKTAIKEIKVSLKEPKTEDLEFVQSELRKMLTEGYMFEKTDDAFLKKYLLVYPYSRIMLSIINKGQLYAKFAEFYYRSIIKNIKGQEINFLNELKIDYDIKDKGYLLNFKDYTIARITKDKDKLVNKPLKSGYVLLTESEIDEFIARYVANRVLEGLPVDVKGISKEFSKYAKKIETLYESKRVSFEMKDKDVDVSCFPQCMSKILSELLSGGKPSHIERYYLATFLFSLKMPMEKVLDIYSKAGDYKADIAKYQLEKIKGYSAPSCNTLKGMGMCNDESSCNGAKSPIDYYWKCKKKKGSNNGNRKYTKQEKS